jgi:hypothetical protein
VDINSEIYAHNDVLLALRLNLPVRFFIILIILEAWPLYIKDNDDYIIRHKKNNIYAGQEG